MVATADVQRLTTSQHMHEAYHKMAARNLSFCLPSCPFASPKCVCPSLSHTASEHHGEVVLESALHTLLSKHGAPSIELMLDSRMHPPNSGRADPREICFVASSQGFVSSDDRRGARGLSPILWVLQAIGSGSIPLPVDEEASIELSRVTSSMID